MDRAKSMGDFMMKCDAVMFSIKFDIFFLIECWWEEVGRASSSTSTALPESGVRSETLERSNVSGMKKQTNIPRVMKAIPSIIGTKELYFLIRYQAHGTPITVETSEAAMSVKKTLALYAVRMYFIRVRIDNTSYLH